MPSASNGMRWSPLDRRYAYARDGPLWIADLGAAAPPRALAAAAGSSPRWTPDGRSIVYRVGVDVIRGIDASGASKGRPLIALSGRPEELGFYGTPTDGRYVYFVWVEDLGDIWVMDVAPAR